MAAAAAAAFFPISGARRRWILSNIRCSSTSTSASEITPQQQPPSAPPSPNATRSSFFPKRGETVELICESLAFKGKGICKASNSGFVLFCDRALPGERLLARVTRKKPSFAEATKLKTLSPHHDAVDPPCRLASHCGGCKTQNLSYAAQLRHKEQQVRDLVVNIGRFNSKDLEFNGVLKPIVPCEETFHYRNKMEFSFGTKRWVPRNEDGDLGKGGEDSALGLHAPGFFDKVLHVEKCFLQSEAANKVTLVALIRAVLEERDWRWEIGLISC